MKTYFKGYYGQKNTGDDAFCSVAAWACKQYWGIENPSFVTSTLSKITVPVELALKRNGIKGGDKIQAALLPLKSKSRLIFAGGSVFHSLSKIYDPNWFYQIYASLGIMELGAVGISIGPFTSTKNEKSIKNFLNKFSYIAVRDEYSYNWANKNNLECKVVNAGDIAGLLPLVYPECLPENKEKSDQVVLGVSLCRYESYKVNGDVSSEKLFEKKIVEMIRLVALKHSLKIRFFIFNGNSALGDHAVTNDIIENISKNNISFEVEQYNEDPGVTLKKISECDALFAIRLHAAIFSHVLGVPFMLYEYHRKCTDYLDDIGMPLDYRIYEDSSVEKMVDSILGLLSKDQCLTLKSYDMIANAQKAFVSAPWL